MTTTPLYKILIIDDEADIVRLTGKVLRAAHYDVFTWHEGHGAIDEIRRVDPHLVLLDMRLPGVPGLELFKEIQGDEDLSRIPVLFFSATAQTDNIKIETFKSAGFISKPYDLQTLRDVVSKVLREWWEPSQPNAN